MSTARYKPEDFNFSRMSERLTFQIHNTDGSYTNSNTVWGHIIRDGFTRQETANWYKILIREHKALDELIQVNHRIKWKNRTLAIHSWQDPLYEKNGFIQILAKQIITSVGEVNDPSEGDMFKDFVSIYRMTTIEKMEFGLLSYEFDYDFDSPIAEGIKCFFSYDRNRYLETKKKDTEHDSLIVTFNADASLEVDDYIISPIHGKFKVDMVIKNENNMIEAHVKRGEVQ